MVKAMTYMGSMCEPHTLCPRSPEESLCGSKPISFTHSNYQIMLIAVCYNMVAQAGIHLETLRPY